MKIHLIKTPEYDIEDFREVVEFLCSFEGSLEFIASEYEFNKKDFYFLRYELFPYHNFEYTSNQTAIKYKHEKGDPLSWRELFSLCNCYRELFNIENDDFVVLLTKRKNALNWFSAKDDLKNIFVHSVEWENYTKIHSKYPIAYQVIENIMQSLMRIDIINIPNQYVHEPSIGCMNDFCVNKESVIIKLQTGNICPDCADKIIDEKIDDNLVNQVYEIFNGIRNELSFKQRFKKKIDPVTIIIEKNNKILLPNLNYLEIRLNPLFKTLYVFYLLHNEGVRLNELNDFREELLSLYRKFSTLSVEDTNAVLELRIDDLVNPYGGSFSQKKSKLNKIITDLLGEPLAQFYRIEGIPGEPFKINISQNLIDIRY